MTRNKANQRQKYLSDDELRRLLVASPPGPEHDLLFVAANLGLRVGEVVRLRIEDLRDDGTISVPCLKRGDRGRIKGGELPQAYETLPLLPDIRAALDRCIDGRTSGWIWPGQRTSTAHITERWAEAAFTKARNAAKLDKAYSFHALRHSFGTRVYGETQDVLSVQALLRHRAWQSSMVYAHMTDSTKAKVALRVGVVGAPAEKKGGNE